MLYKFGQFIFFIFFKLLNKTVIKGKENIVKDGALIIYANHSSNFDPFLLSIAFKNKIHYMAKNSLFKIPVIKHIVKAYGAFPVDRENTDITAIKTALKILKEKKVLGIFPEGTRVKNRSESDPKRGFAMIAYKSKTTVQPVKISYKRKIFLFNRIDVTIGKAIAWDELGVAEASQDEYYRISKELIEQVYNLN